MGGYILAVFGTATIAVGHYWLHRKSFDLDQYTVGGTFFLIMLMGLTL